MKNLSKLEELQEKGAENWLHFDVVEAEKLKWTKDIEEKKKNLTLGKPLETQFGWIGIFLPFEDRTGISEDNRDLFLRLVFAQSTGVQPAKTVPLGPIQCAAAAHHCD
jgi:hypothetical protein